MEKWRKGDIQLSANPEALKKVRGVVPGGGSWVLSTRNPELWLVSAPPGFAV